MSPVSIRGKKVEKALADLEFSRKRIAQDVRKCVMSAVANAENNHGLDVNALVVAEAWVGKNLVMKRFAARGRGRGVRILKPFSQITVIVRQAKTEAEEGREQAEGKAAQGARHGEGQEACQSQGASEACQGRRGREGGRVMGHKVNPIGLRVGINRTWDSRWFARRAEYGKLLHEDRAIRAHILKLQRTAGISKVVIERPHKKCRVTVHTARPGVLDRQEGRRHREAARRAGALHARRRSTSTSSRSASPTSTRRWLPRTSPSSSSAASPSAAP